MILSFSKSRTYHKYSKSQRNTHSICFIRAKWGAYVIFEFWNTHTKKNLLVPTVREKQFVMSVLVSLLAWGCQTQLTTVTRQQTSSEQWPGSSLPSLKAFLRGKLGASSLRDDWIKMGSGAKWASFRWLSHVLTVTSTVFESAYWMTVMRREAPDENKQKEIRLVARMSLGRMLTPVCHQSVTLLTKSSVPIHIRTTVYAHRGFIVHSWLSALSHTQISIWVKVVSLPDILSCQEFSYAH